MTNRLSLLLSLVVAGVGMAGCDGQDSGPSGRGGTAGSSAGSGISTGSGSPTGGGTTASGGSPTGSGAGGSSGSGGSGGSGPNPPDGGVGGGPSLDAGPPTIWLPDTPNWSVLSNGTGVTFDGKPAALAAPPALGTETAMLTAGPFELKVGRGGSISSVAIGGTAVHDAARAFAGGFFIRDQSAASNWIHPGGVVEANATTVWQKADVTELGLRFAATFTALGDRIAVHADLTDMRTADRAVSLYFALPLAMTGWRFGDDVRRERMVSGTSELSRVSQEWNIGAVGAIGNYPWGSVAGPTHGVALAHGLREPRVTRIVANPATRQFYLAFDLGLTQATTRFPGGAWVDFILYPIDGTWGFRAATQGYYDRYPESFVRRLPPEREGIWMPFTNLATIPRPSEFGFGVHETDRIADANVDEPLGVITLRYLSEPWSHWMGITMGNFDPKLPASYDQVIAFLRTLQQSGSAADKRKAEATLSSGLFDGAGRYVYQGYSPGEVSWCPGASGCALFAVNADPAIVDPMYPLNKANLEWSADAKAAYATTPNLDGEYIDNVQFALFRLKLDQRRSHWETARQPLSFAGPAPNYTIGIPHLFASTEYLHWIGDQVHAIPGRLLMGNTMLEDLPWGADVFDYMGVEQNWLQNGQVVHELDPISAHRRALSGQRPYGFLMNTDFVAFAAGGGVERYMQGCLFYGFYPSFFSPNANLNRYWMDATFYERDRPLFVKYVPIIRRLNVAGWEPVTCARSSDAGVYVERFGRWPDVSFTVKNTKAATAPVTVTLDACSGITAMTAVSAQALVNSAAAVTVGAAGTNRTITLMLAPGSVEAVHLNP